jgi:transcriptional regulator with XRE-family HTH domain
MKSIADPRYLEIVASFRAAREKVGLSQEELASRLGKPQSFISKVETCERRLDMLETLAVCQALGITLDLIVPSDLRHLLGQGG